MALPLLVGVTLDEYVTFPNHGFGFCKGMCDSTCFTAVVINQNTAHVQFTTFTPMNIGSDP